jgi:hypothetical protein
VTNVLIVGGEPAGGPDRQARTDDYVTKPFSPSWRRACARCFVALVVAGATPA